MRSAISTKLKVAFPPIPLWHCGESDREARRLLRPSFDYYSHSPSETKELEWDSEVTIVAHAREWLVPASLSFSFFSLVPVCFFSLDLVSCVLWPNICRPHSSKDVKRRTARSSREKEYSMKMNSTYAHAHPHTQWIQPPRSRVLGQSLQLRQTYGRSILLRPLAIMHREDTQGKKQWISGTGNEEAALPTLKPNPIVPA